MIKPPDPDHIECILRDAPVLVLDVETSGLDWRRDRSVGYTVTHGPGPDASFYLPFGHEAGGNLTWNPRALFKRVLTRRQDVRIGFFNAAFDMRFFSADGIEFSGKLEDGQVNAFLINEYQPGGFSLGASCRHAGVQEKLGDALYAHLASKFGGAADRNQMSNFWRTAGNDPIVVDYAAGDGTSTWQLLQAQQARLDQHENLRVIWDIECRLIRVLHRMTARGVRVDEARLQQVRALVARRLELAMAKLPKDFNVKAPTQLNKLFTDAGLTHWPRTDRGNPSFSEAWLETTPLGRDVIAVRKLRHLENSFLTPLVERHLHRGRVHCTYNQTMGEQFGTVTGRLSCSNPNLQQVHKRDARMGSLFRSIFVPDEGMTWASADLNQCEPRLLAHYGSVRVLIDGYLSDPPIDAHSAVAQAAGIDRQSGKRLNQALLTGAGVRKATAMLERPIEEATTIINNYFRAMPEIKRLQQRAAAVWRIRPLRSLLGRVIHLENSHYDYKAVNRLLQCGNADIIKKAMVEIDEYFAAQGDRVHLLVSVHDDLGFQFPEEDRPQYARALELMQDYGPGRTVNLTVPMTVEVGEGLNWAEATYTKPMVERCWREMGGDYGERGRPPAANAGVGGRPGRLRVQDEQPVSKGRNRPLRDTPLFPDGLARSKVRSGTAA